MLSKPRLVSEHFAKPTAIQEDLDAFTGLSEEWRKNYSEFHSFLTDIISEQCDTWILDYFTNGLFYVSTKDGVLECNLWEGIPDMQAEHIVKSLFEAIERTPNRYVTIHNAH